MTDHATPNLPSRDFAATVEFYAAFGFRVSFRSPGWMILERGDIMLEFFPYPALDPGRSSFGACLRLDDLDAMVDAVTKAGVPVVSTGMPRLQLPRTEASGMRIGYVVDPDGSLLRLVQNPQ